MAKSWIASLLRVRGIQEDQAAAKLAEANQVSTSYRRRAAREMASLADAGGKTTLAASGLARASAAQQLAELRAAQQVADGEVELAQAGLILARQARRSAELLKERQDTRDAEIRARDEQNELDELATTAHHRRKPKGGNA